MAGVKISQLPAVGTPQLADVIPEVQPSTGGTTYKVTFQKLSNLFATTLVTPQDGGIVYTDAVGLQVLAPTATANQILQSGANSAPHWSIPTYPSTSGTAGLILASDGTNIVYSTSSFPISVGPTGSIIISNGSNWITSTSLFPNTVGTSGKILQSNGTSNAYSTPTWPTSAGTSGNIIISDGTNKINSTSLWANSVGSVGKIIRSDGTTNTYSTATFADTYTASNLLYSNGANTVAGLATANSATLSTNSSGVPTWTSSMTNGQVLIGSTGATPTPANITGSGGVSIISGPGTINISGSGGGFSWTTVSGTSQSLAANNGYVANNAGLVTFTLPASTILGDTYLIYGLGAGGWRIAQNSGQLIHMGTGTTTTGVSGSISSTNATDAIRVTCTVTNTTFSASPFNGNPDVI